MTTTDTAFVDRVFYALMYGRDQSCPDFNVAAPAGGHANDAELRDIAANFAESDCDAVSTMREGSSNCIDGDDYVRAVNEYRAA